VFFLKEGPDQAKQIEKAIKIDRADNDTMILKNVVMIEKKSEGINQTLKSIGIHLEGKCAFIVEVKRWETYYFELEKESDDEDYFGTKKNTSSIVLGSDSKKDRWGSSMRKDSDSYNTHTYRPGISKMGVVGLKNLGNTCYMNSALQCLSNCKELTQYFLKGDYKQDKNLDNVLGSKCKLVEAFSGLVNKMWYGEEDRVSPYDFKYEMGNFQSAFEGMNQHDSQELLSRLLDGLHEDLNLIMKKPYIEDKDYTDKQDGPQVAREYWVNFLKRNYSKIIQLFYGQFKSEIKCPLCEVVSIKYHPFELVSLPVPQKYEVKDFNFNAYLISENHNKQARKVNFYIQADNKHIPVVENVMNALAKTTEGHSADKYLISFSGFSVHGDFISTKVGIDSVYTRNKDSDYKPKVFIFEKTAEEMAMEKKEGMVYVLAMSKLQERDSYYSTPEYPSFSKMVWSNKDMTVKELYYRIFIKFAHFVNVPKLKDEKVSMDVETFYPIEAANYEELFKLCMNNDKFKFKFLFRIRWDGDFLPFDSTQKLSELIAQADSVKKDFRGDMWDENHRMLKMDIWLDPNLKNDNLVAIDFMKKINSDEIDVKFSSIQKDEEEERKHNLYTLIQKFCEPETLDENNKYKCTNCKSQVLGNKKLSIYKAPKYLIVHMKKLKYGYGFRLGGGSSDHLMVDFPVTDFDLTPYVTDKAPIESYNIPNEEFMDKDNQKLASRIIPEFHWNKDKLVYDCFGVINHYGSMNFGHYTAYAKNNGNWYCYDDSTVTAVSNPERIVTEAAYVLFYERKD
jgi:ubiquitin carboxyl-terminal hydrolase 4/11/15